MFARQSALVDPAWVLTRIPRVSILDASWYLPNQGRDPNAEFIGERIPYSQRFDFDAPGLADQNTDLPHMLPSAEDFGKTVAELGVRRDVPVVVYAKKGFVGAARAWWMFRVFGKNDVFLLNGGLEAWKKEGHKVETGPATNSVKSYGEPEDPMIPMKREQFVKSMQQMLAQIQQKGVIIDARSRGRFDGTVPESRKGLMGGHMPCSFSQPSDQLTSSDGKLLPPPALWSILAKNGIDENVLSRSPISLTCGSGVTAAIISLAIHELGFHSAVYDGSWSEYGRYHDNPVEKS